MGFSPQGRKESNMAERLSTAHRDRKAIHIECWSESCVELEFLLKSK